MNSMLNWLVLAAISCVFLILRAAMVVFGAYPRGFEKHGCELSDTG